MKDFFDPSIYHPLSGVSSSKISTIPSNSTSPSTLQSLYLFGEYGCIISETICSYLEKLPNNKPGIQITFLFPSEKEFLTERLDTNTGRQFDLKSQITDGRPLLVDIEGRPKCVKELMNELQKQLYDVELESQEMTRHKAVDRYTENYFEQGRELFLFVLNDKRFS